ncbi:alpha-L-rhamnosidase C-terminal domain-containing protein [Leifsonia sp. McL0607]|uniref:alpha-L-rhamnosidase C-terminal domain-containing protein n=1 Tax=Leifsonia sp. McL0607 TaxID=3415672 RepID=UPI003CEBA50B
MIFGVAPQANIPQIITQLKTLWGTEGAEPYSSGSPYSNLISPFVTAFEIEAHYLAGDSAGAEELLHKTWDKMIDSNNPYHTGAFWENYAPNGTPDQARVSLAHGWAGGPTAIMTSYVLGVSPADPGYKTFTVTPHVGSLSWADGVVPTPYDSVDVSWKIGKRYSLAVEAPAGTTAQITVPGDGGDTERTVQGGSSQTVTW